MRDALTLRRLRLLTLAVAGLAVPALGVGTVAAADESVVMAQALPSEPTFVIETTGAAITSAVRAEVDHLTDVAHLRADVNASLGVGPVAAAGSAGINVSYGSTVPPADARAAIEDAVATWSQGIDTNNAIDIRVYWHAFNNNGLLGYAGPNGMVDNALLDAYGHVQALPTASYYPMGLVNQFLGYDANGSLPEVEVHLNADLYGGTWYTGNGSPGFGQLDLETVMLHEVGHGLGFLGAAENGSISNAEVFVYDEHVEHANSPLLSLANPSAYLTAGNLHFETSSGDRYEIYAPGLWQEGSSYSHFDEAQYPAGTPGALMTPSLTTSEVGRTLDAPTLAAMADLGWSVNITANPPSIDSISTSGETVVVHWSPPPASQPSSYLVEARQFGQVVGTRTTTANSATLVRLQTGTSTELRVTPMFGTDAGSIASQTIVTPGQPNRPDIVTASGSGSSITVSWSTPNEGSAPIDSYTVQRSLDGGAWVSAGSTSATSMQLSGLGEGIWQFRVRATNSLGSGAWGQSQPLGFGDNVRPVPLDGEIARLYNAYLQRDPDPGGLNHWRTQRIAGSPASDISNSFAGSAEFAATYGPLTNTQFIDLVYQNVLGRPGDAAGRAFWISQLDLGVSRGEVMSGFAESAEFVARTETAQAQSPFEGPATRLYLAFFKRLPDATGLDFWSGQLAAGSSTADVARGFAQSTEFDANYGSLTDDAFVLVVYHNVLDRSPDAAGLAFWSDRLAAGMDRGEMVGEFAASAEFITKTGTLP